MRPLSALEIAAGLVLGHERHTPPPPAAPGPLRETFEAVVAEALERPPCRVSFSGGLDSSLVLAVATAVARREGLPLPVPVTARFPAAELAHEDEWQELVIRHLGLEDEWLRVSITTELDVVGPVAQEVLEALGEVYWPWNLHFWAPIARAAGRGGCMLTGRGGDELFLPVSWVLLTRLLGGRHRPRLRDMPGLVLPLAPVRVRQAVEFARRRLRFDWLTPSANRRLGWAWAHEEAHVPLGWSRALTTSYWPSRYMQVPNDCERRLSRVLGADIIHPFADARVLAAAAARFGFQGPPRRSEGLLLLGGELLPAALLGRRSKAGFDDALWTSRAAAYAGRALDNLPTAAAALVDRTRLAVAWGAAPAPPNSFSLLQAAWLFERRGHAAACADSSSAPSR